MHRYRTGVRSPSQTSVRFGPSGQMFDCRCSLTSQPVSGTTVRPYMCSVRPAVRLYRRFLRPVGSRPHDRSVHTEELGLPSLGPHRAVVSSPTCAADRRHRYRRRRVVVAGLAVGLLGLRWRPTTCWLAPAACLPPPPEPCRHTSASSSSPSPATRCGRSPSGTTATIALDRVPRDAGRPQRWPLDPGRASDRAAVDRSGGEAATIRALIADGPRVSAWVRWRACIARAVRPTTPRSSTRASPRRAPPCGVAGNACRAATGSPRSSASTSCRWSSSSPTDRTAVRPQQDRSGCRGGVEGPRRRRGAHRATRARGRGRDAPRGWRGQLEPQIGVAVLDRLRRSTRSPTCASHRCTRTSTSPPTSTARSSCSASSAPHHRLNTNVSSSTTR